VKTPESIISEAIVFTLPNIDLPPIDLVQRTLFVARVMEGLHDGGNVVQRRASAEAPYAANDDICSAGELAVIQGVVAKAMARAKMWNDAAESFLDAMDIERTGNVSYRLRRSQFTYPEAGCLRAPTAAKRLRALQFDYAAPVD
jgi:hypothetical protein